jgi:microcin C transport system substrate-binding protein
VTADDVIASWKLYSDKTLSDPGLYTQFTKFETPVAESKYIVRVKAKTVDWKHLLNFGQTLQIFPASALKNVTGADYLRDFNFKYLPGTGPYIIEPADIQKGQSLTLRRRKDYWGEKARWGVGLNNFDQIKMLVVRDSNLMLEMLKKGDLDFLYINRSKWWVQDLDFDKVQKGQIVKTKVFNNQPQSRASFAMNTVRSPLDDIRLRKALALLLNRPQLIEKLFFNEYVPSNTYYPGTIYENPDNPKNVYNPEEAVKLLAEAGWKERDSQGRLIKNGTPLQIEMLYDDKTSEQFLTVYQQDLAKAGITLNLRLVTFETQWKLMSESRQFEMAYVGWGPSAFPDPEVEFHSRLAAQKNNNNITSFKDPEADKIMEKYNVTFDPDERVKLIRQLDGILTNLYHDVFQWSAPSSRLAYWNKFGTPPGVLTRTGEYIGDLSKGAGVERLWWIDPEKARKLNQAMSDSSVKLETPPIENHYWTEYTSKMQGSKAN